MRTSYLGSAITMRVTDGGTVIGKTGPRSYLCWEREPGLTTITSQAENQVSQYVDVKAGESYFLKQSIGMGLITARNELDEVDSNHGRSLLAKCRKPKLDERDEKSYTTV